jgi:hypothetical protein
MRLTVRGDRLRVWYDRSEAVPHMLNLIKGEYGGVAVLLHLVRTPRLSCTQRSTVVDEMVFEVQCPR